MGVGVYRLIASYNPWASAGCLNKPKQALDTDMILPNVGAFIYSSMAKYWIPLGVPIAILSADIFQ